MDETRLGMIVIVAAKLLGTALVGRLFIITERQLMQFAWFASAIDWWRGTKLRVKRVYRSAASRAARSALQAWLGFLRGGASLMAAGGKVPRRWAAGEALVLPPGRGAPRPGAAPATRRRATLFDGEAANGRPRSTQMGRNEVQRAHVGERAGRSRAAARRDAGARHAGQRTHGHAGREGQRTRCRGDPAARLRAIGAAPAGRTCREGRALAGVAARPASRAAARVCR